jgi:two-component system LytT family response regulator
LLDIEMPGYSGLDILDFFEEGRLPCALIFVTAYSEHALRAFECSAIDYLLKPVEAQTLERALARVHIAAPAATQYQSLKENLQAEAPCSISLATADGFDIVALCDVLYLKADGAYTEVHTRNQGCITVSKKLGDFEKLLPETQFMRIHRSLLINLQEIQRFSRQDGGQLTLKNGIKLSVSSDRKAALQQYLSKRLI